MGSRVVPTRLTVAMRISGLLTKSKIKLDVPRRMADYLVLLIEDISNLGALFQILFNNSASFIG